MMIRRLSHAGTIALLLTLVACASSLALKQKATLGLQMSEVTLHDLRVAELAYYTAKTNAAYTPQKHIEFLDALDKAQIAEKATAQGLMAWVPSDTSTRPASASDYVRFAQAMVTIAQAVGVPAGSDFLATAQKVLKQANDTLQLITGGK